MSSVAGLRNAAALPALPLQAAARSQPCAAALAGLIDDSVARTRGTLGSPDAAGGSSSGSGSGSGSTSSAEWNESASEPLSSSPPATAHCSCASTGAAAAGRAAAAGAAAAAAAERLGARPAREAVSRDDRFAGPRGELQQFIRSAATRPRSERCASRAREGLRPA